MYSRTRIGKGVWGTVIVMVLFAHHFLFSDVFSRIIECRAKQNKALRWAGVLSRDKYLSTLCSICIYFYSRNLTTAFEFSRNSAFSNVAPPTRALSPVPSYGSLSTLYVRVFYAHVLRAHDVSVFRRTVGDSVRCELRPIRDVVFETSNVSDNVSRSGKRTQARRNSVSDERRKCRLKHG